MKKILIATLFFICSLFIVNKANAGIINENFDSLTNGSLNGQGDWVMDSWSNLVVSTQYISPSKSLTNGTNSGYSIDYHSLLQATGTISYAVQVNDHSNTTSNFYTIGLYDSSNHQYCDLQSNTVVNHVSYNYYLNGTTTLGINNNFNVNSDWIKIDLEYDTIGCRVRFNGGQWSNKINKRGNYTITRLYIYNYRYGGTTGGIYFDNISSNNLWPDNDDREVQIIELPDWEGDIQVGSAVFETETNKRCKIGGTCEIKYQYPYNYIGKDVYMFRQTDINLMNTSENSWLDAVASTTFTDQLYLMGKFTPNQEVTPTTIKYCYVIVNDEIIETIQCTTEIKWSNEDTTEELLEKMGIDPYNISTACDNVASSSGDLWDDIRWGFECAMNKTGYWLFHPQDSTYVKLEESTTNILNEFPINIYQVIFGQLSVGAEIATSTFELPIYLGEMAGTSTVIAWSNEDLNEFGDVWDKIYIFLQVIIYFTVIMYFVHYMTGNKNQDV